MGLSLRSRTRRRRRSVFVGLSGGDGARARARARLVQVNTCASARAPAARSSLVASVRERVFPPLESPQSASPERLAEWPFRSSSCLAASFSRSLTNFISRLCTTKLSGLRRSSTTRKRNRRRLLLALSPTHIKVKVYGVHTKKAKLCERLSDTIRAKSAVGAPPMDFLACARSQSARAPQRAARVAQLSTATAARRLSYTTTSARARKRIILDGAVFTAPIACERARVLVCTRKFESCMSLTSRRRSCERTSARALVRARADASRISK